jgi:membrane protease YdiL (CAAX protease family)
MREGRQGPCDERVRPAQDGTQETRPAGPLVLEVPPALPQRRVPWSALVIVFVWLTGEVWVALAAWLLLATGWFPGAEEPGAQTTLARLRLALCASCLAMPLRVVSAVLLVRWLCQGRPADLGLTAHRLGRNLLVGVAMALVLAPLVYGVEFGLERLLRQLPGTGVQEHSFTQLARQGLSPAEWVLLVLAAVVAAPLWEELFFRGLIQPWVIDRPAAGAVLLGLAAAMGVALRWDHLRAAAAVGPKLVLVELIPVLTALGLVPIFLGLRHGLRSPVPAAIFATSVLFGWFHVSVWPSPVALTLLSLGLGWLAWRSRSLAGPFALHAVFNGIACVVLVVEPLVRGGPR